MSSLVKKIIFPQVIDLPMQKFCVAIENQIEAIFNDAFPANSLGGQWPMPMGVAPPKDTTTPYYGNDESTVCLTEIMDGSTARATFERTSVLSGSQSILHVYGDRTKKARGDSLFDEADVLPSSQRINGSTARATFERMSALSRSQSILHVYGNRTKKARGDSFDEAGMLPSSQRIMKNGRTDSMKKIDEAWEEAGDKIIHTLRNGDTDDFFSDISKDEERQQQA